MHLPAAVSLSALPTPFKTALGSLPCQSSEDNAAEERCSETGYELPRVSLKPTGSRPTGAVQLSGCRAPVRSAGPTCAPWVPSFLASTYFQPCERHRHHKKNECTFFCTTCVKPHSVCQHCMGAHAGHQVIQVRRYVYCDVVRACDINPFVDTTGVQNYIINSAKVMFLHHRPQSKMGRPNGPDVCATCARHLREGFSYCSLACKVEALTKGETCGVTAPAAAVPVSAFAAAAGAGPSAVRPRPSPTATGRCHSAGPFEDDAVVPSPVAAAPPMSPRPRQIASVAAATATAAATSGALPYSSSSTYLPRDRLLAAAAAAVAAAAAAAASAAGTDADVDTCESSEPGEETVAYGSNGNGNGAASAASRRGNGAGMKRSVAMAALFERRAAAAAAAAAEAAEAEAAEAEDRDLSHGSASSEDERFDLKFENPPKRRRSYPTARRPTLLPRRESSLPYDPAAADVNSNADATSASAADAAAAAAAAALLMPYRSASLPLTLSTSSLDAAAAAAAAAASGAGCGAVIGVCGGTSVPVVVVSRRKQSLPQRAPTF